MIDHYPFATQEMARNHARAANLLWRERPDQPVVVRNPSAPEPPPDVIAIPVQRPDASWAVLVYQAHASFVSAIDGQSVTVQGATYALTFPPPQAPPLRLVHDAMSGTDVVDPWGAEIRDTVGAEP
jgi:hypothetical protein